MKFTQVLNKVKNFLKGPITKDSFFKYKNLIQGSEEVHLSPSGKYKLVTSRYSTKKGCWAYSRGTVTKDGKIVADVKRNYSRFPFAWAENHPNGHDYLICGEDYQGQTIIELDTGKRLDHLPEDAKKGWGFCWAVIHPSPDKLTLAVEGCYWACPYEVVFIDFSEPMQAPKPLEHQPKDCNDSEFFGWNEDGTAEIGYLRDRRKSDGKWVSELTDEEEDKMYDEDDYEEVPIKTTWKLDGSTIT